MSTVVLGDPLNTAPDIQAAQYWDDIMDAYEQHKGSLLPLWKFYTDHARRKQASAEPQKHRERAAGVRGWID